MINTCCEDLKLPGTSSCACRYPLPIVCDDCVRQHSNRPGFHFMLPLYATEVITSQRLLSQARPWLVQLSDTYQELMENKTEVLRCEQAIEGLYTKAVNHLLEVKDWYVQHLTTLKERLNTAMDSAIKDTMYHALESSSYVPIDPLTQLVWWHDTRTRDDLKVFQYSTAFNIDALYQSFQVNFSTTLPGFEELNMGPMTVPPQILIEELNKRISSLEETHQEDVRRVESFDKGKTRDEVRIHDLETKLQEVIIDLEYQRGKVLATTSALKETKARELVLQKIVNASKPTQIFVKTIRGNIIALNVMLSDLVITAKRAIEEKEGLPPDAQRLIFAGKTLADNRSLLDSGVESSCTLTLLLRNSSGFLIHVKNMSSFFVHEDVSMTVAPSYSIEKLRANIKSEFGLLKDQLVELRFEDSILRDDWKIGDCGLDSGAVVYLEIQSSKES